MNDPLQDRVMGIAAKKAAGREAKTEKLIDRTIRAECFTLDGGPTTVYFWPRMCIDEINVHFPDYRGRLAP